MDVINEINVQVSWPIIGRLQDDQYPFEGYDHVRYTARGIIENEKGEFGFLHIVGEDFFGERNHLETCGGGMEEGEYLDDTIKREVMEELGLEVLSVELIGSIYDAYNLIKRITFSTFFHCKVDTSHVEVLHRTEEEEILIKEVVWLKPEEALDWLENRAQSRCDKLVQRRDAMALRYYLENCNK